MRKEKPSKINKKIRVATDARKEFVMNSMNNNTPHEENWLNFPFPQNQCPFCGEDYDINFEREDDGYETVYWATCQKCYRTWGQHYTLTFVENIEYDEEKDAPLTPCQTVKTVC